MTADGGAILGRYAPDLPTGGETVTIQLLNFPLQVFMCARQHHDELMRECALAAMNSAADHVVPADLQDLIQTLGSRYAGVGDRADAYRDAAAGRGEASIDLTYVVPRTIGVSMNELHALMEQADQFCRDGKLLTLATTPVERDFRLWFLRQFTNQAAGAEPEPWTGPLELDS